MRRTVYDDYWVGVLRAVVENPMQRSIAYASRLGLSHGRATHVLIGLKKNGYIGYYDYKLTNEFGYQFVGIQRHYYPFEKGIAVVRMIEANIN